MAEKIKKMWCLRVERTRNYPLRIDLMVVEFAVEVDPETKMN